MSEPFPVSPGPSQPDLQASAGQALPGGGLPIPPAAPRAGTTSMDRQLDEIESVLTRMAELAGQLLADPDGHLRRSVEELQATFAGRGALEPAVARVRTSLTMVRAGNHAGPRREFQRREPGLDRLNVLIEEELLPDLRRLGLDL